MGYRDRMPFASLLGKTLVRVEGLVSESDGVLFVCDDGSEYALFHDHDCCESVLVADVVGDVANLIGSPITMADESSNNDRLDGRPASPESFTWTFYKLATGQGYVDIRWLGESNGYYGEVAVFERTVPPTPADVPA